MSDDEAIDIAVGLGEVYAVCNERGMVFKPQSFLPRQPEVVVQAMKLSYQTGYPFSEQLEHSYHFCFPQIAFFILDEDIIRERAYFERCCTKLPDATQLAQLDTETKRLAICQDAAHWDYMTASVNLNTVNATYGTDPRADQFFDHEFLADGPQDTDGDWVRALARKCWKHLRARVDEWEEFVSHLPVTG